MDLAQIKEVISLMKTNDLCSFEMEEKDFRLALKRVGDPPPPVMFSPPMGMPMHAPMASSPMPPPEAVVHGIPVPAKPAEAQGEDPNLVPIESPLVGTFYRSPSPDADPFVGIGTRVEKNTVVGIIEAMKVMNEIKAEVSGVVEKVLVDNATTIQYGQPLFLIRKG